MADVNKFTACFIIFGCLSLIRMIHTGKTGIIALCLKDLSVVDLQREVLYARHNPVCVLFRKDGVGYKLEQNLSHLWLEKDHSFSFWQIGNFPVDKYSNPRIDVPTNTPVLRCYVGSHKYYDFTGESSKEKLYHWFMMLGQIYADHFPEATEELVTQMTANSSLTLLAFLSEHRHYEVEEIVYDIRARWSEVSVIVVHPRDNEAKLLTSQYQIKAFPSVVFIENTKRTKSKPKVQNSLQSYEVRQERIEIYLNTFFSSAQHISQDNFEAVLMVKSKLYVPMLLLLHTTSNQSLHYITAFHRAVYELQDLGVNMRFGIMEVDSGSTEVLVTNVPLVVKNSLPLTVLFRSQWKKTTVVGIEQLVIKERPTPLTVLESLRDFEQSLKSKSGEPIAYDLWNTVNNNEISVLNEGPRGTLCTPYSSNATDNEPNIFVRQKKYYKKKKYMNLFGTWHERYATESMDAQLTFEGSIPVVTEDTWNGVVETSHAPLHPFYPGQKWRGEVTKVALIVFVITDCGSCRRNKAVFEDLQKAVKFVDGGSLYLANCTSDPGLCRQHNVTGFPSLIAYRGLGWMESSECMPRDARINSRYVRLDYHGVITENSVMEWFARVAGSAVTNSRFSHLHVGEMKEDSHLVATLVPKTSTFLPRVANKNLDYFYPYECFRLACEQLYGQVPCYVQYSTDIPHREFEDEDQDMVITMISLHRADSVWSTVMKLKRPLKQTLEEESSTNMYQFHKPHSYNVPSKVRCEDDHSLCTGVIIDFAFDHSRLPITHMTTDLFHTRNSVLFYENLPILIAFVYAENITKNAPFQKVLMRVAYEFYTELVVVSVNVEEHAYWSGLFMPKNYGVVVYDMKEDEYPSMYMYPRFCIVEWDDHRHAAFYPPPDLTVSPTQPFQFTSEGMMAFVSTYLQDPAAVIIETEHF